MRAGSGGNLGIEGGGPVRGTVSLFEWKRGGGYKASKGGCLVDWRGVA